ncbi:Leucine-rich_repeat domain superfamily [Hexamita inflata]|uniref:Leucine-rich repeat domain superfamily n=1 Tax=Hexamita inflata TaxID=28002 RepID=A0AA86N4S0_9EUKA|nr:Leucine-rich repeat domain superfamily [Hexamita inflata]
MQLNTNNNNYIFNKNRISLSDYDNLMIEKHQIFDQLQFYNEIQLERDPELNSLEFLELFPTNKLMIVNCENIIPKIYHEQINQLSIEFTCDAKHTLINFEDLNLDNIQVLKYCQYGKLDSEEGTLDLSQITQYKQLKELILEGWQTEINEIIFLDKVLTKLITINCGLQQIEAFGFLVHLVELNISENIRIVDITPVQYLTKLKVLKMNGCGLDTWKH